MHTVVDERLPVWVSGIVTVTRVETGGVSCTGGVKIDQSDGLESGEEEGARDLCVVEDSKKLDVKRGGGFQDPRESVELTVEEVLVEPPTVPVGFVSSCIYA